MKRRMFALLLALMLAASCCWTGFSEETEAREQAFETEKNEENVAVYELNSDDTGICFHSNTRSENALIRTAISMRITRRIRIMNIRSVIFTASIAGNCSRKASRALA